MQTALIYDWLVTQGGGEKVLEAIEELFPSPVFTLVYDRLAFAHTNWAKKRVIPSGLQKIPFAPRVFRNFLPFFPSIIEQIDLRGYDVVISCSHAIAKGVLTRSDQLHICYCYTPMRYAWDLYWEYMHEMHGIKRRIAKHVLHRLRNWDVLSAQRVDAFVAISSYVAKRIQKTYRRNARVIFPPVATHLIPLQIHKENFFLTASRLVPYKKIDLIVEAFGAMPDKRLVVAGDGPELKKIKSKATSNVEVLGHLPEPKLRTLMGQAKGFLLASEEDFGIAAVEAQAAGTPVIAYGKGGALETVLAGKTGLFFKEQTIESIVQAVQEFERFEMDAKEIRSHAEMFSYQRFAKEFTSFVNEEWEAFCENSRTRRW